MTDTKTIYQALLEAQKEIETIKKDATANAGSFKYNYATLGQVMDMVKKPLNDNGISIIQPIDGSFVFTKLVYTDGTTIGDGGTQIICARQDDPQAQGSAISYARRYGLMSLLCLSAEDDDGAKAMPHASPTPVKQTITPQPNNLGSCPKCNAPLVYGVQKSTGKEYLKCSTAKWNAATKTSSGCDFFKWKSVEVQEVPDKIVEEEVDTITKAINELPF